MSYVVALAMLCGGMAWAQEAAPPQHHGSGQGAPRVVTMTRPMAAVSQLENQLEDALAKGDEAALGRLVKDDFSLWTPNASGDPTPRAAWLQQAAKTLPVERRNLAVEAFSNGEVYVASFVALRAGAARAGGDRFVVDVWTKSESGYQLAARYQSSVSGIAHGARRPTGKQ